MKSTNDLTNALAQVNLTSSQQQLAQERGAEDVGNRLVSIEPEKRAQSLIEAALSLGISPSDPGYTVIMDKLLQQYGYDEMTVLERFTVERRFLIGGRLNDDAGLGNGLIIDEGETWKRKEKRFNLEELNLRN
jgi:hypothetical protein